MLKFKSIELIKNTRITEINEKEKSCKFKNIWSITFEVSLEYLHKNEIYILKKSIDQGEALNLRILTISDENWTKSLIVKILSSKKIEIPTESRVEAIF